MSFHLSANEITVEDNILMANLADVEGEWQAAELDLNTVLGNNNGSFQWGGEGFAGSAEDISFALEGDDNVPVLRANLFNVDGESIAADVNLGEMIHNDNGSFFFANPAAAEGGEEEE